MKLFGKMTLMAMAMTVTASFGFLSPALVSGSASGATLNGTNGLVIELTDYTSTYELGDAVTLSGDKKGFKLPTASVKNIASAVSADLSVTAKNRANIKKEVVNDGGNYYLVVSEAGVYEITYSAGLTSTRKIMVEIKAGDASFKFDENSSAIMPAVVYAGDRITFPKATVVDGEGETITTINPTKLTLAGSAVSFDAGSNDGFEHYTVKSEDKGEFAVTYTYTQNGNNLSKTFTFKVQTARTDVELDYESYNSGDLSSFKMEVGVESKLPVPVVVNKKANDAVVTDVYTVVKIKDETSGQEVEVTDFKFTPQNAGSYRITYVTKDFHGNTCGTTVKRTGIKLTANSIQAKVIGDYSSITDKSTIKIDERESVEHSIPTIAYRVAGADAEVTIPAMFAVGGWGTYDNIKITRSIWLDSSREVVLEETTKPGTDTKYTASENVVYKFTKAGKYEVRYNVQYMDNNGQTISGTSKTISPQSRGEDGYYIEVKDVDVAPTDTNLKIDAPSVTTAVDKNAGETITFTAPTVSDDDDKDVKVDVKYSFDNVNGEWNATKNDNGTYSIKVVCPEGVDWSSSTKMTITFTAKNDLGNIKTATKDVELLDFSSDASAPVFNAVSNVATYDNDTNIITLPNVSVNADDTNVILTCTVLNEKKKEVASYKTEVSKSPAFTDLEYKPTEEGTYTFNYVAVDQNNNTSTFSLTCEVSFRIGYSIAIESISTKEYGDEINLAELFTVTKAGKVIDFANSNVIVVPGDKEVTQAYLTSVANNSLIIQVSGAYDLVPGISGKIVCKEGNITLKAWAKDNEGVCDLDKNTSSTITFESKDTKAPEFKIEGESDGQSVIGTYDFTSSTTSVEVVVPWFDAQSITENTSEDLTMKIEVFLPGKSTSGEAFKTFTQADVEALASGESLKFTATKEGKYNIKYSISDVYGNSSPRTFVVEVGDVVAPEIVLSENAISVAKKVGETFVINLDEITLENDTSLSKVNDLKIKVTVDGSDVETTLSSDNTKIEFTAATAGSYVITFDVTDEAGNVANTVTKTYVVKADSTSPVNSTTIWGTVLIVISLVVLGLVIFFFVKPSKTKGSQQNKNKTKTK